MVSLNTYAEAQAGSRSGRAAAARWCRRRRATVPAGSRRLTSRRAEAGDLRDPAAARRRAARRARTWARTAGTAAARRHRPTGRRRPARRACSSSAARPSTPASATACRTGWGWPRRRHQFAGLVDSRGLLHYAIAAEQTNDRRRTARRISARGVMGKLYAMFRNCSETQPEIWIRRSLMILVR